MSEDPYLPVREYLKKFDIDADRIPADTIDEDGYDYWPPIEDQPFPRAGTEERRSWPSPEVYDEVLRLTKGLI